VNFELAEWVILCATEGDASGGWVYGDEWIVSGPYPGRYKGKAQPGWLGLRVEEG